MKVGDYVRFYDRDWTEIGQIVDEVEDSHLKVVKCKDDYYDLDNFIKSSPSIIDLIEVGDYINGNKVLAKEDYLLWVFDNEKQDTLYYNEGDIKSIVTKELFEKMEYKVGD